MHLKLEETYTTCNIFIYTMYITIKYIVFVKKKLQSSKQ